MPGKRTDVCSEPFVSRSDPLIGLRRRLRAIGDGVTTAILDLLVVKPIGIFVWVFSQWANELYFRRRRELLDTLARARAEGRPVLIASNHVSWFDDPVIPMALHRTGPRAALELSGLLAVVFVCVSLPDGVLPPAFALVLSVAAAIAVARLGARKTWWTLGDRMNLSNASVLEGKLALTRDRPPGPLLRAGLRIADRAIPWFMHSGATKTIFVDRGAGEVAKRARAAAVEAALERACGLENVWVFYEGGRTRTPGVIAPARRGIGSLVLGLRERGLDPLVVVIHHRGMERLIPPGGSRFLSTGHRVDVDWCRFVVDRASPAANDALALARAVRESALALQRGLEQELSLRA